MRAVPLPGSPVRAFVTWGRLRCLATAGPAGVRGLTGTEPTRAPKAAGGFGPPASAGPGGARADDGRAIKIKEFSKK